MAQLRIQGRWGGATRRETGGGIEILEEIDIGDIG